MRKVLAFAALVAASSLVLPVALVAIVGLVSAAA
jgi:hypothetical protein